MRRTPPRRWSLLALTLPLSLLAACGSGSAEVKGGGVDDGADGSDGLDGGDGADGADGEDSGGADGSDGADGADGGDPDDRDADGVRGADGDCDDDNAAVFPGAPEASDGLDNDCDVLVDEDDLAAGSLLVTEVLPNPGLVADTSGEWFELHNPTDRDINLIGWTVVADDGEGFTIDAAVIVPAGGYAALGVDADEGANGGAAVAYAYSRLDFSLSDETDSGYLYAGELAVTGFSYTVSWPIADGVAMQLDPIRLSAAEAALLENWCAAPAAFGLGDLGSPSAANGLCPNIDHDDDGVLIGDGDCDDLDPTVFPEADEVWDNVDNDCDGIADNLSAADATSHLDGVDTDFLGFNQSLSAIDYNDDGVLDLVVGGTYLNSNSSGGVHLIDGAGAASWAGDAAEAAAFTIDGGGSYGWFGTMGAQQGDQDGDGLADLAVAGSDGYTSEGTVAVSVFANADIGDANSDDATWVVYGAVSINGNVRLDSALDLDGDGADEVIFGDHYSYSDSYRRGYVTVLSMAGVDPGAYYLYDADNVISGVGSRDGLGWSLGGGDVDGDGYDDLLSGAPYADLEGASDAGCVYLFPGAASLALDDDADALASVTICGAGGSDRLGWGGAPQVADFDGDGTLDLAVGAPGDESVALFWDLASRSGALSATDADLTLRGDGSPDSFGWALGSGDVDGDGQPDLVIGAPDGTSYNSSLSNDGAVWMWTGAALAAAGAGELETTGASLAIRGNTRDAFGQSLLVHDWTGDGHSDLVVAAPNWQSDQGQALVFVAP
ncbi:MAG: FG-GAP repeat protein [Deltaproteobacteria bacterium]|nr:FG-GAP repeat protein [Deltaproteobacteria bacterium]